MVEVAWVAVEHSAHWKVVFQHLEVRIGRQKAIVAVARKLLVAVWHVLSDSQMNQHSDAESIARKFMTWGTQERTATRQGLSRPAFVRQKLDQLRTGQELQAFKYAGTVITLPPSAVPETVEH